MAGFEIPALAQRYLEKHSEVNGAQTEAIHIPEFAPLPWAGMLAFAEVGNGDQYTLYWPEGSRLAKTLILSTSHDVYGFVPEASSFEAMLRVRWAALKADDNQDEDEQEELEAIEELLDDLMPYQAEPDYRGCLRLDPDSPFYLTAVGDFELEAGALEAALAHYSKALEVFPSYTAAREGLAAVYRRWGRPSEALIEALEALLCPLQVDGRCFWSNFALPRQRASCHQSLLEQIRRVGRVGELPPHLVPVWEAREQLDFERDPPNWKALAELSRRLQGLGHQRLAIRVEQGLAPLLSYALGDFDEARYYRRQLELYQELGDTRRSEYLQQKLSK